MEVEYTEQRIQRRDKKELVFRENPFVYRKFKQSTNQVYLRCFIFISRHS